MLAKFFNKVREIIEAAETPFAKMAMFLLPVLAPIVPATFTSIHLYSLLLEIFSEIFPSILVVLAVIVGMVLEMLGYVGAIEFVHSIFRLVRGNSDKNWLQVALTGLAYVFYLVAMFQINVQLSNYFQTPKIVTNIVGLLSFITVPTGLLAANYLGGKTETELDNALRREHQEYLLERYRIKHGSSRSNTEQFRNTNGTSRSTSGNMGRPSIHEEKVFKLMKRYQAQTGNIMSFKEVQDATGLPQSTVSRLRNKWIDSK